MVGEAVGVVVGVAEVGVTVGVAGADVVAEELLGVVDDDDEEPHPAMTRVKAPAARLVTSGSLAWSTPSDTGRDGRYVGPATIRVKAPSRRVTDSDAYHPGIPMNVRVPGRLFTGEVYAPSAWGKQLMTWPADSVGWRLN